MTPPSNPTDSRQARGAVLRRRLARAGRAFDAGILECQLLREPDNVEVLAELAEAYTRMRRYREGLELDRRLVRSSPEEPLFRYNLACSLALTGHLEQAVDELLEAFALGYADLDHLERDADLRRLREAPCFARVTEAMKSITRRRQA